MRTLIAGAVVAALGLLDMGRTKADEMTGTDLKPFAVTVRVFDPAKGLGSGRDYVLPVDSPDAEHAAASTLANAASFTRKTDGGVALPVAFACVKVEPR